MNTKIINITTVAVRVRRVSVSLIIFTCIIIATLIVPAVATASINLDQAGKIKLFGDVRLRIEADNDKKQNDATRSRERLRFRARFGASFKANDEWSGKLRFSTASSSLNSPHQDFGTGDPSDNASFGIDQAYVAFTGVNNLTVIGGKTPLNFWQTTEVFWDTDINPEALAVVYKIGPMTLNTAYVIITEGDWSDDVTATTFQVVNSDEFAGMKYTVAAGGATLDGSTFNANKHFIISAQLKQGRWRAALDYIDSDAEKEDSAYVAQFRYKVNKTLGLRVYYYYVETFATLGDGLFTQDNFGSAENSADNFEGYRLQLDYKLGDNSSLDVRYYDAKIITEGVDGQAKERSRGQVNINVKF